ncbi:MAG: ABC transporter ATP-binding protein [Candidatus Lokiarchaeota archaeon]|nr:ABC transporter ATP-binding protein [Candidatus Lokiarchaeota archaeon]
MSTENLDNHPFLKALKEHNVTLKASDTSEIPPDSLISVRNLSKVYTLGDIEVPALNNANFDICKGQIVFIVGPSGSGKTTLLNLIGGIDSCTTGVIYIDGQDITQYSGKKLTRFRKRYLSFVFQFYSLLPTLTALENVELTMELIDVDRKTMRQKARDYLDMVELSSRANNFPSQLSGGERQRVAIARALAKKPSILLVDEPTGQLDQKTGDSIVRLIQQIAKQEGITVILVTHDQELLKYADRVIQLRSGDIISDGVQPYNQENRYA